jgi:NADPH-dependent curcumin reductase CurA
MTIKNKQWRLISRPEGDIKPENFQLVEEEVKALKDGEFLIKNIYLSLDPTHRLWTREKESYLPSVQLGDVMRGFTMGVVEASKNSEFPEGQLVTGVLGWEEYSISDGTGMIAKADMDKRLPLTARFGLMEHIGLTAYFGIMDILKPKAGEVLVVSGAAGAVGSIAVQIGKIMGCYVVGIAGSDEKCAWLRDDLGIDEVINYRTTDLSSGLEKACPNGVDMFFDNVGGKTLEAVLDLINMNARIAMCGAISVYGEDERPYAPSNIYNLLMKRAKAEGFIVLDYAQDARWWKHAENEVTQWYLQGRLKYKLDIEQGLDVAPEALTKLFRGENKGKLLVKLVDEPSR